LASWLIDCRRPAFWLVVMLTLGLALGAVQFVPLYEVAATSFRAGGGLLPLCLALIAVLANRQIGKSANQQISSRLIDWFRHPHIPFFTLLSLFSLGCIFGTPLYALVYALPFISQSHSPFRWVFPLTLSVAILAGFGVNVLIENRKRLPDEKAGSRKPEATRNSLFVIRNLFLLNTSPSLLSVLASLAAWGGLATLIGLALSRVFFTRIEPLVERVFLSLAKAPAAFPDHRAFYSYEFKWAVLFGLLLTATGIVLRVSRCPIFVRRRPVFEFLAVGLLVLDFVTFGAGFNPAVDPALLDYTPPVVEFLQQDTSLWRYATFTPPGTTKTMNPNVGMFYDLQTVAGYDSIFSRQYADYMALIEEQDELQYNQIASFSEWSSLDSPLTDLLNVKYIITEVEIPNPKYRLVYQDEAVRVYENLGAMPRAWTLPFSAAMETDDLRGVVQDHDPRNYVILDLGMYPLDFYAPQPGAATGQQVTRYTGNEVEVDAQVTEPSWLILADTYFPGWKAFVRPRGGGQDAEQQVLIYRVNGNFRGVLLKEPGAWTVRFKYSPDSVKVGAFITFIAGMMILFLAGLYLWRFFYREEDDASTVRRVAKNSIAPIILNLFNRAIDLAFAALMARVLGPVGNGQYAIAIAIFAWFDILTNFGLDVYLMREVARDKEQARRLFANTTVLRLLLVGAAAPLLVLFLWGWQAFVGPLAAETAWAVVLLYAGLLPGSVANGLASLFTNVATLTILALLARRLIWPNLPRAQRSSAIRHSLFAIRTMLTEGWPLMASLLLQMLFPGINVLLLQHWQGDAVVGWYDAARKWVDALNIIPAFFTFALFPVMSRQAAEDRAALARSYRLSVKLLALIALPAAVSGTLLAYTLVGLLSGSAFLPDGAIALQVLVWAIPFGWINSLTNYVLIALNRQRYVLLASGARVVFAIVANLLFVARFSYVASAWVIIGGELLLALLFNADLRRHLGPVGWVRTLGRPALAGLAMGAAAWAVASFSRPLALLVGLIVYLAALVLLRVLTPEEWALLSPLLPAPLRQVAPL